MKREELESMSIEQLDGLQGTIQFIIRKKKASQARDGGRSFVRLKDIPAPEGHTHNFRNIGAINNPGMGVSLTRRGEKTPSRYACECGMSAYSCPTCGYVPREPNMSKYDNISCLAGSAGYEYHCGECGEFLGRDVLEVS